jgi:hypothetical protein
MRRVIKSDDAFSELRAFRKGRKPGLYVGGRGKFENGRFVSEAPRKSGFWWWLYNRLLNKVLRENNFVHAEVEDDGKTNQRFFVYKAGTTTITPEMLKEIEKHHREVGLAIGIPEFAVEDFMDMRGLEKSEGKFAERHRVRIKKLGLVFVIAKKEESLEKLDRFLLENGLHRKDAEIK